MSNKYGPDRLSGGNKWDVLVKNSAEDGDFSWKSFDTRVAPNAQNMWDKDFSWQAKDFALLARFEPSDYQNLGRNNEQGYVLGGTRDPGVFHHWDVDHIPQTYNTLYITGQIYQQNTSGNNFLRLRFNKYDAANYWWQQDYKNTSATKVAGTGSGGDSAISLGMAADYTSTAVNMFEMWIPQYNQPYLRKSFYGRVWNPNWNMTELWGYHNIANTMPWNQITSLRFFASSGFISSHSTISIYGIK